MGVFSDYCYRELQDRFRTPYDEVGSRYPGARRGRSITNCIIYVGHVLKYGYSKIGRRDASKRIHSYAIVDQDGMKLAKYLVRQLDWKAHYWNPDVRNPRDNTSEHPVSYKKAVASKTYYGLSVSGFVVDYNKSNKKPTRIWLPIHIPTLPIPIPFPASVSSDNLKILEKLGKVKFAFGIARGGYHTFLFSQGNVFEVRWEKQGVDLYRKVRFRDYEWLSGLLLTPPDSTFVSEQI